jgi:DNA repair photolyase
MITDRELEHILEAAYAHGARAAGYVLLRLPHELKQIWREWLELHYPDRAAHVMSLIQQMRGGKDYDSAFGKRMRGEGPFAQLLHQRFAKAHARLGFGRLPPLDASRFTPPRAASPQGELF